MIDAFLLQSGFLLHRADDIVHLASCAAVHHIITDADARKNTFRVVKMIHSLLLKLLRPFWIRSLRLPKVVLGKAVLVR